MNINPFLFNSIINAKAKHLGRNHQFIYCQLPDGKTIKAYALTHVSSANVNVVKFEGNYYCFCGSAPVELSRSTKQLGVRVRQQKKEQSLLFLLIDITKSLENDGILQAINYINTHNYQSYQYLSFGDTTGYISEPLSKTNILTELQDYYDNYNPNYDDDFYCSEGTDLPENGIDALNDAILSFDNKYLVDLYLVTDNSKYSRNTSDPEDILDLIDNKINKLFIDIIEPKNVPSEHIVIEGFENNPYCSNSAITTVLVNDIAINNYPSGSEILIETVLKIIWDGGGIGNEYEIQNPLDYEYAVYVRGTQIRPRWVNQATGWALDSRSGYRKVLPTPYQYYWRYYNNGSGRITSETEYHNVSNNFYPDSLTDTNIVTGGTYTSYPSPPSGWTHNALQPASAFTPIGLTEGWISLRDGAFLESFYVYPNDYTTVQLVSTIQLKINGNVIQTLEETDTVKAICQPQIVPLTEPNSTLYTTSLPPSNKIIYLD